MPSWKRVIVSGSNAALNSLNVTTSVTASIVSASAGLITDNIQFNTGTSTVVGEGQLAWNPTDGTLDLGMKGGLATQQIGQETYYPPVVNKTAAILREGTLVMVDPIAPSFGNRLSVIKAVTDGTYPTDLLVGIITEDIAINGKGFATWFGYIRNLNENNLETYGIKRTGETWVEGNILYPDPVYPGGLTNVEPSAPALKSTIAAVTTVNGVNITLLIRPTFKFKLEELSDVGNASQNGDLLVKSGSIWTPSKQLSGSYGLTGSLNVQGSITGSLFGTASYATTAGSTTAIAGTDNYVPKFNGTSALENSIIYDNGTNVGIGETTPGFKLTVRGSGAVEANVLKLHKGSTADTGGHTTILGLGTEISAWAKSALAFERVGSYDRGKVHFLVRNDANSTTATLADSKVTIDNTGNVGIGTTSPAFKLDVTGSAGSTARFKGSGQSTVSLNDGTVENYIVGVSGQLRFAPSATTAMTILSGGNVGIGTTSPAGLLHLKSDFSSGVAVIYDRTQNSNVDSLFYTGVSTNGATTSDFMWMGTSTSDMTITGAGNVGIGTSAPGAKLHISGTGLGGTVSITDTAITDTNYNTLRLFAATQNKFALGVGTSTSYPSHIVIDGTTGNVGIGTTAPGAKLDVEGDVLIKAANLSNQENLDVDTGTEVIATVAIATYTAAFFDFVIKNGTNVRSGTVFACHDGTNVEFTETSTADLGNTTPVTLSVDISGTDMRLLATATTDNWSVKTLVRAL